MHRSFLLIAVAATMLAACTGEPKSGSTVNAANYQTQNTENMEEVCSFLKRCGTYYVATIDGQRPRVRPFGTVNIFDGKLYIQTGRVKRIAKQLADNPNAEICAFNGSEWIRIETTLVADERIEAQKSMLDSYPSLQGMYKPNDGNTLVLYMTNSTAYISSFTAPERVLKF